MCYTRATVQQATVEKRVMRAVAVGTVIGSRRHTIHVDNSVHEHGHRNLS